MTRNLSLSAALVAAGVVLASAAASPADAAGCYYRLRHEGHGIVTGKLAIQGYASAFKLENACNRARRECNRRLDRARARGEVPRAGPRDLRCVRTSAG